MINGSGTFDAIAAQRAFGPALARDFPFAAYVSKTITLQPRAGNPPPRLWETPGGLINSIGLPNKGLDGYLPRTCRAAELLAAAGGGAATPLPLITNVMGSSARGVRGARRRLRRSAREIAAIELNVSCPNVETGLDIGADPAQLRAGRRRLPRAAPPSR